MPQGFYRELVAILKKAGCIFHRDGKGDHEIWFSLISNRTFSVDRSCRSKHTANAVLKQAGLPKAF